MMMKMKMMKMKMMMKGINIIFKDLQKGQFRVDLSKLMMIRNNNRKHTKSENNPKRKFMQLPLKRFKKILSNNNKAKNNCQI